MRGGDAAEKTRQSLARVGAGSATKGGGAQSRADCQVSSGLTPLSEPSSPGKGLRH